LNAVNAKQFTVMNALQNGLMKIIRAQIVVTDGNQAQNQTDMQSKTFRRF
jgi:hypothetical protein